MMNALSQQHMTTIHLGSWLQNKFDDAVSAGWLKCQDIFPIKTLKPAFRYSSPVIRRAKQIQIGNKTVIVAAKITQKDNQQMDVSLRVCPYEQSCLPDGLKFIILSESGEPLTEIRIIRETERIEHLLRHCRKGQEFGFRLEWKDMSVSEYFMI